MATLFVSFMTACAALFGGMFNQPSVMQSIPPQAAMVQSIVAPVIGPLAPAIEEIAAVAQNLLPSIKIKPTAARATSKIISSAAELPIPVSPTVPKSPTIITAQSFLGATTLVPIERRDGPFEVRLTTDIGTGQNSDWDFSETSVGGGSIPTFSMSYSCDPMPNSPIGGSPDQNPTFAARTSYACTVSLTPVAGSNLQTQSRQFSFVTPAGQLIVTPPSAMDTVLKNNEDNGGFVFDNEDTQPVTITQLTVDVSYTGLSTVYGPIILRAINPANGQSTEDYHLENAPADPSRPHTYAQSAIAIPVSLTLPAGSQKLLPIQLLGVHTMSIEGVNPVATVTLRGVTTNPADNKAVINGTQLLWNCIVTFASYDPNATSGALAAGNACGVGGN